MPETVAVIERFYSCLARRDAEGTEACYAPDVVFEDPVFGTLEGPHAGAMWAMLCERAADLAITLERADADARRGQARWHARYRFAQTGRRVHNVIDATFEFRDGRIVRHRDRFSFWRWARQALGFPGLLLGWTPVLRARVRATALTGLESYMRKRSASGGGA